MPVDSTTPDRPAAKAKGTVNPSDIPMTMSRIFSEEVKWVSTCGVWGISCAGGSFPVVRRSRLLVPAESLPRQPGEPR
jgi:hypothetical protein